MFKLYLFFSDLHDVYNATDDNDSVAIVDMAHRLWAGYSREQLIALRDACYLMQAHIERYITSRFDHP